MYLMYVDESGDCGVDGSPSRYFCLAGMVVHELRWRDTMAQTGISTITWRRAGPYSEVLARMMRVAECGR